MWMCGIFTCPESGGGNGGDGGSGGCGEGLFFCPESAGVKCQAFLRGAALQDSILSFNLN